MSLQTVIAALKTKIKADFTYVHNRVYVVPTKVDYLLMQSYATPGVGIVYTGGVPILKKGTGINFEVHNFELWIFLTIWKEEDVVEGLADQKGLAELRETLRDIIDGYTTGNVFDTRPTGYMGTEEYPELGSENYSACIGIAIEVRESV